MFAGWNIPNTGPDRFVAKARAVNIGLPGMPWVPATSIDEGNPFRAPVQGWADRPGKH